MILAGTAAGEQELERFRSEAELIAQFQHPNIVQVFEVGECVVGTGATCPYMVLEYCPGGSLTKILDGQPWEAEKAARLVEQLARTMHAAHLAGIIHRDLKPANILLSQEGPMGSGVSFTGVTEGMVDASGQTGWTAKITDFGLAKRLGETGERTRTGAILGTPEYMAPEQAAGKPRTIGPLVDVYALGVILYELLTGQLPLRADSPLNTILLVMEQEPTAPRTINPSIPRNLETICLKCLHKDASKRYESALALADDLRRHLDGEAIQARPPSLIERINRHLKRRPGLILAYTVFAIALLIYLQLHQFFVPVMFVMGGVSQTGVKYAAFPAAAAMMALLVVADFRFVSGAVGILALAGAIIYFAFPSAWPVFDTGGVFLRTMAWWGLLAALIGLVPRARWGTPLLVVPLLLGSAGLAWLVERNATPFLAGAVHGLLLGLLARIVAWGLNRDRATCALGTAVGAVVGLQLGEWYGFSFRNYLSESGLGLWHMWLYSLYLEICVAFAAAMVVGMTTGSAPLPRHAGARGFGSPTTVASLSHPRNRHA
jgi:hypothetical protein